MKDLIFNKLENYNKDKFYVKNILIWYFYIYIIKFTY